MIQFSDIREFFDRAKSTLVKVWADDVARYAIINRERGEIPFNAASSLFGGDLDDLPDSPDTVFYCGYCIFTEPPFEDSSRYAVLMADVHGEITYAERFANNVQMYGFDCGHSGDEYDDRCSDVDWLTTECEKMAREILRIKNQQQKKLTG